MNIIYFSFFKHVKITFSTSLLLSFAINKVFFSASVDKLLPPNFWIPQNCPLFEQTIKFAPVPPHISSSYADGSLKTILLKIDFIISKHYYSEKIKLNIIRK